MLLLQTTAVLTAGQAPSLWSSNGRFPRRRVVPMRSWVGTSSRSKCITVQATLPARHGVSLTSRQVGSGCCVRTALAHAVAVPLGPLLPNISARPPAGMTRANSLISAATSNLAWRRPNGRSAIATSMLDGGSGMCMQLSCRTLTDTRGGRNDTFVPRLVRAVSNFATR